MRNCEVASIRGDVILLTGSKGVSQLLSKPAGREQAHGTASESRETGQVAKKSARPKDWRYHRGRLKFEPARASPVDNLKSGTFVHKVNYGSSI